VGSKPIDDKTWPNIEVFISNEYTKENKQNKLTMKQFKANQMEEQADTTEELIANLTEAHTKQMEMLIQSMTESMKEMMNLMKATMAKSPNANSGRIDAAAAAAKKKKTGRKSEKIQQRTRMQTLQQKHPSKPENECWELKTNASSCPTNWKSSKST
jgi:hypothetical protein